VKPAGRSIGGLTVALIGFGDIGKATAQFLHGMGMKIQVYDPYATVNEDHKKNYTFHAFPEEVEKADFVVVTCALNPSTKHIINEASLALMKTGVYIVNVSRGPIIDEKALIAALQSGKVDSVALDVFEEEPLPMDSPIRGMERCILGTHNGSNTLEGVRRASEQAMKYLFEFLHM
jgi:D-3-phosphoglycerate dehydrogenase